MNHHAKLGTTVLESYKTISKLNGLDPLTFFTFAHDFRTLRPNHQFKLRSTSADSVQHSFYNFICL